MTAQLEDGYEKDSEEAAAVDGRAWKKRNPNSYAIYNGRTPHGSSESKHKSFLHLRSSLSREISSLRAMNLHPSEELEDEIHVHALMNSDEHGMNSWLLLINDLRYHKIYKIRVDVTTLGSKIKKIHQAWAYTRKT